jgi:hypothetical protein
LKTYADVMRDIEIPAHLQADAEVPVISGFQRQGDVAVIPMRPGKVAGLLPIPAEGIAVVRGESGGNTHLLVAEGPCFFAPNTQRTGADQGTLEVQEGGTAFLTHPEHGAQGIGAGQYTIRRQLEQAEEIKLVQD